MKPEKRPEAWRGAHTVHHTVTVTYDVIELVELEYEDDVDGVAVKHVDIVSLVKDGKEIPVHDLDLTKGESFEWRLESVGRDRLALVHQREPWEAQGAPANYIMDLLLDDLPQAGSEVPRSQS